MRLHEVDTIAEVILQLETYIDYCIETDNRMGYFASLYCSVTKEVQKGIVTGRFEDGKRMEILDVHFANFFFKSTQEASDVWKVAFDSAKTSRYVLLQHLLLGMNAHINFDLALAVTKSVSEYDMPNLYHDYDEINSILIEQIDAMQNAVNRSWWPFKVLDFIALRFDEAVVGFSLIKARESAWNFALKLQRDSDNTTQNMMQELTLSYAQQVQNPKGFLVVLTWLNHLFEPKSVTKLIQIIRN